MQRHLETAETLAKVEANCMNNKYELSMGSRTVIAHRNVCDDLLQHRLPLYEFLILSLGSMQLSSQLLQSSKWLIVSGIIPEL